MERGGQGVGSGSEEDTGRVAGSLETELVEGLRTAANRQRSAKVDPGTFESDLSAALIGLDAAVGAGMDVARGNSLEHMLRMALGAVKQGEAVGARLKSIRDGVQDVQRVVDANVQILRDAMAEAVAVGVTGIQDEHHTVSPTKGKPKLRITDPAKLPYRYLETVPNEAAIRTALLEGKEVPGAVLEYGDPGIVIRAKTEAKGKRRKG